ncbi:hypothetical protein [Mycobacterium leprae]|uniref:hypothetical protein n=1 Tax=Mycobacterium leprae TaxID=1769 RepID=UPI0002E789F0|nr:hypothetical protein [Mycobacterium leprae]
MSFVPAGTTIGPQVLDTAAQGTQASQNISTDLTVLAPSGTEELSLYTLEFFLAEANQDAGRN